MSYVDSFLVQDTLQIANKYGLKTFVETGTHDGRSPRILEPNFNKLYSCEIDGKYFQDGKFVGDGSQAEYFANPKFKIVNKSSPEALPEFFAEIGHDHFILYLDAHWHNYWPLLDELKVCKMFDFKPFIIIHDFDILHRDRFGYDEYHGQICGLDFVRQAMDEVYGIGGYLHTTNSASDISRGVGFFLPKHKVLM